MVARRRIVVLGLLAAGVAAGWASTLRDDDGAPDQAAAAGPTTTGTTTDAAPLASVGSFRDRLERLPAVAPGDLEGVLDLGGDGCARERLDLGTLVRTATPRDVCAAEGAKFGVRLRDLRRNPRTLGVIDTDGNFSENVPVPQGWDWWGLTAAGIVFCDGDARGRLRAFGGGTTQLSSCPLTVGASGLLFASADKKSDRRRRRPPRRVAPPSPARLRTGADVRRRPDRGRRRPVPRRSPRSSSLDLTDGVVLGASRSGDVTLVSDAARAHLAVMLRDGTRRSIDPTLASRGGALSPDGRHLLLQHDDRLLLDLDAATLQPLARIDLDPRAELLDWRPAVGS